MNTKILKLAALLLTLGGTAYAYNSGSVDPTTGEGEKEYRVVKKSETAGVSDEVLVGHILSLDINNNNDGYTVTRVGANNVASASRIVCIASKAIATGNVGLNRCVSKGYVSNLRYDATTPFVAGAKLCSNTAGVAVACAVCDNTDPHGSNNCRFGTATENTPIVSLEAKASGTGSDLKALINSR